MKKQLRILFPPKHPSILHLTSFRIKLKRINANNFNPHPFTSKLEPIFVFTRRNGIINCTFRDTLSGNCSKTLTARRFSLLVYGKHCKLMGCAGSYHRHPLPFKFFILLSSAVAAWGFPDSLRVERAIEEIGELVARFVESLSRSTWAGTHLLTKAINHRLWVATKSGERMKKLFMDKFHFPKHLTAINFNLCSQHSLGGLRNKTRGWAVISSSSFGFPTPDTRDTSWVKAFAEIRRLFAPENVKNEGTRHSKHNWWH